MEQMICDERHKTITEKLISHDLRIAAHNTKIESLLCSDATKTADIKNICAELGRQSKKMGQLTTSIWGFVLTILGTFAAFFIWYIQTIPRT
jgi:hypothetical protein